MTSTVGRRTKGARLATPRLRSHQYVACRVWTSPWFRYVEFTDHDLHDLQRWKVCPEFQGICSKRQTFEAFGSKNSGCSELEQLRSKNRNPAVSKPLECPQKDWWISSSSILFVPKKNENLGFTCYFYPASGPLDPGRSMEKPLMMSIATCSDHTCSSNHGHPESFHDLFAGCIVTIYYYKFRFMTID